MPPVSSVEGRFAVKALNIWVDCPDCDGSGTMVVQATRGYLETDKLLCPKCGGQGQVFDPKVIDAAYLIYAEHVYGEAEHETYRADCIHCRSVVERMVGAIVAVANTVELEWETVPLPHWGRPSTYDTVTTKQRLVGPWFAVLHQREET